MTMGAFEGAVLMRDAGIVAGRGYAIVAAQFFVATGEVCCGIFVEVAERRRQAVAAMLAGNPAQRPQGVLDAFRQGDETLATEHDVGMLEAGIGKPKMIEPAVQGLASDRNAV